MPKKKLCKQCKEECFGVLCVNCRNKKTLSAFHILMKKINKDKNDNRF